jgi:hypothetical protein
MLMKSNHKPQPKNSTKNGPKKLGAKGGVLLLLAVLLLALFAVKQVRIYQEKAVYDKAEKQIVAFIEEVTSLERGVEEINKECSYSSAKYDDGFLGCGIYATVKFKPSSDNKIQALISRIRSIENKVDWKYVRDNTWNPTNSPKTEILNTVYSLNNLSCGSRYSYGVNTDGEVENTDGQKSLKLSVSCTGPALKEYYPT